MHRHRLHVHERCPCHVPTTSPGADPSVGLWKNDLLRPCCRILRTWVHRAAAQLIHPPPRTSTQPVLPAWNGVCDHDSDAAFDRRQHRTGTTTRQGHQHLVYLLSDLVCGNIIRSRHPLHLESLMVDFQMGRTVCDFCHQLGLFLVVVVTFHDRDRRPH